MKKIIAICFILMLISLAGCGAKRTAQTTSTPTQAEVTTPTTAEETSEVADGISDADALDKDLDTSDVDSISDELADIDW